MQECRHRFHADADAVVRQVAVDGVADVEPGNTVGGGGVHVIPDEDVVVARGERVARRRADEGVLVAPGSEVDSRLVADEDVSVDCVPDPGGPSRNADGGVTNPAVPDAERGKPDGRVVVAARVESAPCRPPNGRDAVEVGVCWGLATRRLEADSGVVRAGRVVEHRGGAERGALGAGGDRAACLLPDAGVSSALRPVEGVEPDADVLGGLGAVHGILADGDVARPGEVGSERG